MNTYQVQINESVPLGQSIIALLRSATEVVSFSVQKTEKTDSRNDKLQKSLRNGFNDVREIIDGKQKRTTIDEFINDKGEQDTITRKQIEQLKQENELI